jgi:hypothetical protein
VGLEETCDLESWSTIQVHAMKGDVLKQTEITARIFCVENYSFTFETCPQAVINQIIPIIQGLQQTIEFKIPGGYNHPFLSRVNFFPSVMNETEVDGGPPRTIGIGNGQIEAMRDVRGDEFMPIYLKALMFEMISTFIKDGFNPYTNNLFRTNEDNFEKLVTEGYLFQKYKHFIFTEEEILSIIPSYRGSGDTNCAFHLGAYYALKCETLEEVMDIQLEIISKGDLTCNCACSELESYGYRATLKTGKKAVDSQTTGSRCTNACTDSAGIFEIEGKAKGTCDWVFCSNADDNGFPKRCELSGAKENCPDTCGTCCVDAQDKFYILDATYKNNKNRKERKCAWADRMKTEERCALNGVAGNCPETCGVVGCV